MTLLSRPVRGTVRRTPDDHSDNDGPPMKRPRLQQELGHRRRQSSPDCLDTTTPDHKSPHGKLHLNPSSLKIARPRTATRRARRLSNSSGDSIASSSHFHTAGNPRVNGNSLAKTPRVIADRDGPSGGASILLADARESPDPLDTISPSPTKGSIKPASRIYGPIKNTEKELANSPTTTRTTRQNDLDLKVEEGQDTATASKDASRPSRNTTHEGPEVKQQNASEVEQTQEQDASAQTRTERRSLRSTDTGSRSKSELAQYFYNYEQIISLDEPKPVESLTGSTTIVLIDDLPKPITLPSTPDPTPFGNPLQNLHNCKVIDLPNSGLRAPAVDPLNEELYFRAHRKFERQEKQLRNIERDRAQHEKQQLDRLLEDLRGQDWLRVMGLTGVHENEKNLYEPKRQILIQELVALVNKFQTWKDEERRRKTAKEKPIPQTEESDLSSHSRPRPRPPPKRLPAAEEISDEGSPLTDTPSTPPDPHDVDALAARQLHQEARSASVAKHRKSISENRKGKPGDDHTKTTKSKDSNTNPTSSKDSAKRQKTLFDMNFVPPSTTQTTPAVPAPAPAPAAPLPPPPPPPPDKPFTSFFSNRKTRDEAVAVLFASNKTQTATQAQAQSQGQGQERPHPILAFGHPIPEAEETDFQPPPEILTEEAIYSSQRQMRRLKRQSRG